MTMQSTIHIDKWLYNWLYIIKWLYNWLHTEPNDYTIDDIQWLFNRLYTSHIIQLMITKYTIDYVHSQMTIQLTIHVAKWLYYWLYT